MPLFDVFCGLSHDSNSISDCITSNGNVIREYWIGKHLEGDSVA
jgi:hypothetical protein